MNGRVSNPDRKRWTKVAWLGVAIALFLLASLSWHWRNSSRPLRQKSVVEANLAATTHSTAQSRRVFSPDYLPQPDWSKLPSTNPRNDTPRGYLLRTTAIETTAQCVLDLGNMFTLEMGGEIEGEIGLAYHDIREYSLMIPRHVKALRLIQEGREFPEEVSALIRDALRSNLDRFQPVTAAIPAEKALWLTDTTRFAPRASDHETTAANQYRYASPSYELSRIYNHVYQSLYVLGNIDRLDAKSLQATLQVIDGQKNTSLDMEVYLIDLYYHQPFAVNAAGLAKHRRLWGNVHGAEHMISESCWDQKADETSMWVQMGGIDADGVQTLQVTGIPLTLDLTDDTKQKIVANFLDSVNKLP